VGRVEKKQISPGGAKDGWIGNQWERAWAYQLDSSPHANDVIL
jgi:hypothetical protein